MVVLFLVHGPDWALPVIAAMRADAVRRLGLVTLRTEAGRGSRERVVRAPFRGASFRVSTFWIRHLYRSAVYSLRSTVALQESPFSAFNAASRGSSHTGAQSQEPTFRFVPHCEQSPLQSSRHNGFIGSAK